MEVSTVAQVLLPRWRLFFKNILTGPGIRRTGSYRTTGSLCLHGGKGFLYVVMPLSRHRSRATAEGAQDARIGRGHCGGITMRTGGKTQRYERGFSGLFVGICGSETVEPGVALGWWVGIDFAYFYFYQEEAWIFKIVKY